MIDKWNSNEHTDVILDNALDNLSLSRKDVANELGVSQVQVSRLENKILEKLKNKLK